MAQALETAYADVNASDPWKGVIAGAVGGFAGCVAMNAFQRMWTQAAEGNAPESAAGPHDAREWQERQEGRNSNEMVAQFAAEHTIGRHLTRDELAIAAPVVHFAFGAAMGALYGYFVETGHKGGVKNGARFGMSVWAAADEAAMPALGLSNSTLERPSELHMQSFASHVVFGVTTEMVRRTLRAVLR
jgi:putative membrane protein